MKYFILFALLLFSFKAFSQNNQNFNSIESNLIPIYNQLKNIQQKNIDFALVEEDYANKKDENWLLIQYNSPLLNNDSLNKSSFNQNKGFTSFKLMEQLEILDNRTPFNIVHNPTLERYIRVYLNTRKESLANLMDRAKYYFPLFEKQLDKYNLPLEIKYLAVVESALKPNSVSPTGAKGLWQFIYTTGKQYGLDVNSMVDDRFDPIKSTEAACLYLQSLHQTFNDWDLALAAYNAGPGNVAKAIRRSGGNKNYWEIRKYLPQETQGYLPAFYATFYLFEHNEFHQIKPKKSGLSYFEIDTIHIKKQISFSSILQYVDIESELLKALNPQYKNDIIPFSNSKKYTLTLPKYQIGEFVKQENEIYNLSNQRNLHSSNSIKINELNSYEVKQGDNLSKIANKYNISLLQLKKWNGLLTNYLIAGQRLVITDQKVSQTKIVNKESTSVLDESFLKTKNKSNKQKLSELNALE
ncbi:MAG: transglycosylase SLT domain-containing protein [Bacteroidota bacterium]